MNTLIGELLTLAKLEADAYRTQTKAINISELLAELLADATFEYGAQDAGCALRSIIFKAGLSHER